MFGAFHLFVCLFVSFVCLVVLFVCFICLFVCIVSLFSSEITETIVHIAGLTSHSVVCYNTAL